MSTCLHRALAATAFATGCMLPLGVAAADAPTPAEAQASDSAAVAAERVEVTAIANPGSLAYNYIYRWQQLVERLLAAEPRHLDFRWRVFRRAGAGDPLRLLLMNDETNQRVEVDQYGFFLLPDLPAAHADETRLVLTNARKGEAAITSVVLLRLGSKATLPYRDLASGIAEARAAVAKLPWYLRLLMDASRFEKVSFCFKGAAGSVLVASRTWAADPQTGCTALDFDSALAQAGEQIEFRGELAFAALDYNAAPP
jgi:hypothetical protein